VNSLTNCFPQKKRNIQTIQDTLDIMFTLEIQMGKPTSSGVQSISVSFGYNAFLALYAWSSWPKDPLRVILVTEIGRYGVMGRPIGWPFILHFSLFSLYYFFLFTKFSIFSLLSYSLYIALSFTWFTDLH